MLFESYYLRLPPADLTLSTPSSNYLSIIPSQPVPNMLVPGVFFNTSGTVSTTCATIGVRISTHPFQIYQTPYYPKTTMMYPYQDPTLNQLLITLVITGPAIVPIYGQFPNIYLFFVGAPVVYIDCF